jgi:nucleotide-binding universal stress UspA family protein
VRVLVATDGSAMAMNAMRSAARILSPEDRHLDLLCVMPPWNKRDETARKARYEERLSRETATILERAKETLRPDAQDIRRITDKGSPAAVIAARTVDYDLTVLGAVGSGFKRETGLGPVASRVVEHALGPVLVGRAMRSDEGVRILAAVDGSAASLRAVTAVAELCDLTSGEMCLMYVAETPWLQLELDGDWATSSEEEMESSEAGGLEKEFVREGDELIEDARRLFRHHNLLVNTRVEEGNPANEILAEAERGQYDLVVVGATGNRDLKHRMLGSVSSRIAWEAPCSVLIAYEPGQTG